MLRALAWKEWREQRPVVLAGIGLTLLLPVFLALGRLLLAERLDAGALAYDCAFLYGLLLWPLTALLAGAGTMAGEKQAGTLSFLFTRPVGRARIWAIKVAAGAAALVLVAVVSDLVARGLAVMTGGTAVRGVVDGVMASLNAGSLRVGPNQVPGQADLVMALLLLFAISVLFSALMSRPLLVVGAALVMAPGLLGLAILARERILLMGGRAGSWLEAEIALAALLLLTVSLLVFARGEMLRGAGRVFGRTIITVGAVLLLLMVVAPARWAFPPLVPGEVNIRHCAAPPGGGPLLMEVQELRLDGYWGRTQIWSVGRQGQRFDRLTGSHSWHPAFTPDGTWVVYLSRALTSLRVELRKMRPDGSEDEVLVGLDASRPVAVEPPLISPDGRWVALAVSDRQPVAGSDRLLVVDLQRHESPATLDLGQELSRSPRLVGWIGHGREVVFLALRSTPEEPRFSVEVLALDVVTGEKRTIASLDPGTEVAASWQPAGELRRVPVVTTNRHRQDFSPDRRFRFGLSVVDLDDGSRQRVTGDSCWWGTIDMTPDARWLAYAVCAPGADGEPRREVRLRDLVEGVDIPLADMDESIARVRISSDGAYVLAASCEPFDGAVVAGSGGRECVTHVLPREGEPRRLPEGWLPLAWAGPDEIYLGDNEHWPRKVARASAGAESFEIIFP